MLITDLFRKRKTLWKCSVAFLLSSITWPCTRLYVVAASLTRHHHRTPLDLISTLHARYLLHSTETNHLFHRQVTHLSRSSTAITRLRTLVVVMDHRHRPRTFHPDQALATCRMALHHLATMVLLGMASLQGPISSTLRPKFPLLLLANAHLALHHNTRLLRPHSFLLLVLP